MQGPGAAEITFEFREPNKKGDLDDVRLAIECADAAARDECFEAANKLLGESHRKGVSGNYFTPVAGKPLASALLSQGLAFFDFTPTQDSQVALKAGDVVVVLDRSSESRGWVYGYCARDAGRRGLIPVSHIEFMPIGAELKGCVERVTGVSICCACVADCAHQDAQQGRLAAHLQPLREARICYT